MEFYSGAVSEMYRVYQTIVYFISVDGMDGDLIEELMSSEGKSYLPLLSV